MKTPTSLYDYHLLREKIAQQPAPRRDRSHLLVVHRSSGATEHRIFRDILKYLRKDDLLVINDTRVFPARMFFRKETGARIELLFLYRHTPEKGAQPCAPTTHHALRTTHKTDEVWSVLARPGKRLKPGVCLTCERNKNVSVAVEEIEKDAGTYKVRLFSPDGAKDAFEKYGEVPLPPYIHEPLRSRARYQTVYAAATGSTAAPTAGMHFTPALMKKIRAVGCQFATITLHIGPATFRPIRTEVAEEHPMHPEWYSIPRETAAAIINTKNSGGRVIAVGTTSVRTLETWAGLQIVNCKMQNASRGKACLAPTKTAQGWTNLYVTEGFQFRVVDALITNFHLPRSTLIVLVSAFCGRELLLKAYNEAIAADYRFYSFGDAMLIL